MSIEHSRLSGSNLLLLKILLVKIFGSFFAHIVFSKFTQLGDSAFYISGNVSVEESLNSRTSFLQFIGGNLPRLGDSDLIPHLVVSVLVGISIFLLMKNYYAYMNRWIKFSFWSVMLLPSFLVWSSVVGKEAVALIFFCLALAVAFKYLSKNTLDSITLIFFVAASIFIRPHYAVGLSWFVLVCVLTKQTAFRSNLSTSTIFFLLFVFLLVALSLCLTFFSEYFFDSLDFVMRTTESYFLSSEGSAANRYFIDWDSSSDFFYNLWWGLPFSVIGPLPSEVFERPVLIPFFLEGVFLFFLLFFLIIYSTFSLKISFIKKIFFIGLLPSIFISLLFHYPFGIFNSGSALRYKQALVPILYFSFFIIISMDRKFVHESK